MDLVIQFMGRQNTIPIPVPFVRLLGDYASAAFLSQCLYWTGRTEDAGGWFYKSREEWAEELCLTEKQVRRCMEVCGEFVEVQRRGIPARNYYRPNQAAIAQALQALEGPARGAQKGQLDKPKRAKQSGPKGPNSEAPEGQQEGRKKGQLYTEPTTETTHNLRQKDVVVSGETEEELPIPQTDVSSEGSSQIELTPGQAEEHQPPVSEDVPPAAAPLDALRQALSPWSADKLIAERTARQGERGWLSLAPERIWELRQVAFEKHGNRYRGDLCALLDTEITKNQPANGTDAAEKDWLA
ncbi:hypothetical protein WDJ50_02740 [Deinococcus sp. VB142]|uniref:Helix-turn-helix domain-containing protein n=1 Tax=Deinococcus sp. VB142 TaxID=3112952 RepID=A0AAU6Q3Z6_9DEIO